MMLLTHESCLTMMKHRVDVWFDWTQIKCKELADCSSRLDLKSYSFLQNVNSILKCKACT